MLKKRFKGTEGMVWEAAADPEPKTPGGSPAGAPEWVSALLLQGKLACPLDTIRVQSWVAYRDDAQFLTSKDLSDAVDNF